MSPLGCTVEWSKRKGLKVTHPRLGLLKTGVSQNTCPYVQEHQALRLIEELELLKLSEFENQVQNLECELQQISDPLQPALALKKYVETGSRGDALRAVFSQPYLSGVPETVKVKTGRGDSILDGAGEGSTSLRGYLYQDQLGESLLSSQRWVCSPVFGIPGIQRFSTPVGA